MPNLLAMSFEGELTPSFDLRCLHPGTAGKYPDGWGVGYYPPGEPSAQVLKEPAPSVKSQRTELIKAWDHLESSTFVVHIRTATWGSISDANTQPFSRIWGGREWLFAHSGSLSARPEVAKGSIFEPVGSTDSEVIFCELMNRIADRRWNTLGDSDPSLLHRWMSDINDLGTLNLVLTDGRDLCVYVDRAKGGMDAWEILPPYDKVAFLDDELEVDLTRRGVKSRKGIAITTRPLGAAAGALEPRWRPLPLGQLLLIRQGVVRAEESRPGPVSGEDPSRRPALRPRGRLARPTEAAPKRLQVVHRTVYRYEKAVERSMHLLRLRPAHDRLQTVLENRIDVNVPHESREYEDVFGNWVRRLRVDTPFQEMVIEARSLVEVKDTDPLSFRPLRARTEIPLVWMPWHRHMLNPYLLPPESPESELTELTEYAMSFVKRNDYHLLDTLLDLNASIFSEYRYRPGATTLATSPYQVYCNREGVCQDFTNLFICLMRLLGVPARYVCGYIFTGPKNPNQRQSEASHAWVQVYLPEVGWKGFDPTNGVLTQTDHVRVATGRVYSDATPTSGTIFVGGGPETLEVDVRVDVVE
jgi:transglutaminase-like putative cysteine protease/predicted glutamine amidotransferase